MADDAARIAQLEAENCALRDRADRAEARLVESLEQHTALAEVLRVIATSPTDVQPVLDAVAERAARLCDTYYASVLRVDDDVFNVVARYLRPATGTEPTVEPAFLTGRMAGVPIVGTLVGRTFIECRTIHVHDILTLSAEEYPLLRHGSDCGDLT